MITQNSLIGHAKQKLGNVYARTMYGKNILQSCPVYSSTIATDNQKNVRSLFKAVSNMANVLTPSQLNQIYYYSPTGCNRRMLHNKQLQTMLQGKGTERAYDCDNLQKIGTNSVVTNKLYEIAVSTNEITIPISTIQHSESAILDQKPIAIAIDVETPLLYEFSNKISIENGNLIISELGEQYQNRTYKIAFLWKINIGTAQNPIIVNGAFEQLPLFGWNPFIITGI